MLNLCKEQYVMYSRFASISSDVLICSNCHSVQEIVLEGWFGLFWRYLKLTYLISIAMRDGVLLFYVITFQAFIVEFRLHVVELQF